MSITRRLFQELIPTENKKRNPKVEYISIKETKALTDPSINCQGNYKSTSTNGKNDAEEADLLDEEDQIGRAHV